MPTAHQIAKFTRFSREAIDLRVKRKGLSGDIDPREVIQLTPLESQPGQMTLEKARTELALQQARKAKVVADEAEGSVVQVEDVRADMTALLETIAATIKASGISAKQQNDLFKIIREGGEEFDRKYGWNA